MKRIAQRSVSVCLLILSLFAIRGVSGSEITYHSVVDRDVPDGSTSGLISTIDVAELGTINAVSLTLNLDIRPGEAAFLGDLYAYLQHGDKLAVLVNRPGRGAVGTAGYSDNVPVSVTFNDTAANGDFHNYRLALNGSHDTPLLLRLTGLWQPDGRSANPDTVALGDPRATMLNQFVGGESSQSWTLSISDVSAGGRVYLRDWTFSADITAVPEPEIGALALFGAAAFLIHRKRK